MLFSNLARVSNNVVTKRYVRQATLKSWPNDWVPFIWSRPVKEPGYLTSGDLVGCEDPAKDELNPGFRCSEELKSLDADHPLRKMFSLDHAKKGQQSDASIDRITNRFGLIHTVDFSNSLEAKIISLTFKLRQMQEAIKQRGLTSVRNCVVRTAANSLLHRRYRYLCELKEQHRDRYERIIKTLNIEPPENLINIPHERPFRKIQMRRLALEYARDLKEKKVEEFMKTLEKEKAEFVEEKKKTLEWIKEQENKLGMTV